MPSVFSRLISLFPGFTPRATPDQRADLVTKVKDQLAATPRRAAPSTEEKLPNAYGSAGIAGKVWFLPYRDSATQDTAEIRAAMRLMRRDPYVKAAWEPQILTVASEDYQVQPSEEGNPGAEEQADFVKTVIEDYISGGMPSLVRNIAAPWGSDGFSLAEKVWGYAEKGRLAGKIVATAVKARDADPNVLRIEGDTFNNVKWVKSVRTPDSYPITDFIFSRYMTVFDEPLGQAAFRPAYGAYWQRDTVRKLRIIHTEKKMAGMLMGTYANPDDQGPLEAALAKAKTATWLAVPEGCQVECINLSTASEPDYKSLDESLRDEIVTGIAFATLQIMMGNVPDARGDSQVQKSMYDLAPWLIMTLVQDAINTQLIPDLIDYNFPFAAAGGYPKLTFGAVSNQELLELIQVVTGAQQLGFTNLSKKHYAKTLSLQLADPNDPDDVLAPPGQAGAMGGFGGGLGGDPYGMGGGFPPDDGTGGGVPALAPSVDPNAPQGGATPFSDQDAYHSFAWSDWKQVEGNKWKSPGGRTLSNESYQRLAGRKVTTPTGAIPGLKHGATQQSGGTGGILRRAGAAVGRAASGAAKAVARTTANLPSSAGGASAAVAGKTAGVAKKVAEKLKKVGVLERRFGIGRAIERAAGRAEKRAEAVKAAFAVGSRTGAKKATREVTRAMGVYWKESKRKYGVLPALVIEGLYNAWVWGGGAASALVSIAPGLGGAKRFVKMIVNPIVRKAIEYPFKAATRLLSPTKRTRQFAEAWEFADADPMGPVIDLRRMIDESRANLGLPPVDATDDELAVQFEELLDYVLEMLTDIPGEDQSGEGVAEKQSAEAFAEDDDFEAFAWEDWKQDGKSWKSPGGRTLSDASYQRLRGGKGAAPKAVASAPPAGIREIAPHDIAVDPQRFQFKLRTDAKTGVGSELHGVQTYNPELAGVLAVWHDPADGKNYVVNGHHRLELAKRAGAGSVLVRHLKAATAQEARAKGALINIAEGRGTAVDAAKFLRDTGTTVADLNAVGISLTGPTARDAVALSKLDPGLFHRVTLGMLDTPRALAVANHLPNHDDQRMLLDHIDRQERATNKAISPAQVAEAAKEVAATPRAKIASTEGGLFEGLGGDEEESLFLHRADVKSFVRQAMANRVKNFGLLSSKRRAGVVTSDAGNVVDPDANRAVVESEKNQLADFDRAANGSGPVSRLINKAAEEIANARTDADRSRIKSRVLASVRDALSGRLI